MKVFLAGATVLALSLIGSGPRSEPELTKAGFVALPQRPSEADIRCGNFNRNEWIVSGSAGRLRVALRSGRDPVDPLPFADKRRSERAGDRHVVQVADGWLVGYDAGEFGGDLWWFSTQGERSERLRPPANSPVHPNDIFRAENVRGFARREGDLLVFMGLDHLEGRSGRAFRLVRQAGHWSLRPFAVFDGSPASWVVERDRILVLTESGLWLASPEGGAKKLHDLDAGLLYPASMIAGREGALYIGMRRYVLRLEGSGSDWRETWFVQSDCVKAEVKDYQCLCVP